MTTQEIVQPVNQTTDLETVVDVDRASSAERTDKPMTPIRKLAKTVEWYIWYQFRRANERGVTDLVGVWNETIVTLAQFDIQLSFKNRPERGHDKVTRYTFFVSQGAPRPMSSFRLQEDCVTFFKKVPDRLRVVITQPFSMNKEFLNSFECFPDFHNLDERIAAEERSRNILSNADLK